MAQVTADVSSRIDHFLDYALSEWTAVPSYAEEFDTWDEIQQLAFVHEWAIRESALQVLRESAGQGLLSRGQRSRYDELLKLVARHCPTLERLLAE